MENASKALIIAGAILISILLISLGITMFNASKGTTEEAKKTTEAIDAGASSAVTEIETSLGIEKE